MRIKMDLLPSMTKFLKMHPEIKPETYNRYQNAIKSARKAGQIVAKGLGGVGSITMEGLDIRLKDLSRIPYKDAYINKLAMGWESRAENAFQVFTERQDTYLTNLLTMMLDEDYLQDAVELEEFKNFLARSTDEEKARFIKSMKGRGAYMLYDPDTGEPVVDFGSVITAIRTEVMGDKRFLFRKASREEVSQIRSAMMRSRHGDIR